jgi:hypothetical protein
LGSLALQERNVLGNWTTYDALSRPKLKQKIGALLLENNLFCRSAIWQTHNTYILGTSKAICLLIDTITARKMNSEKVLNKTKNQQKHEIIKLNSRHVQTSGGDTRKGSSQDNISPTQGLH